MVIILMKNVFKILTFIILVTGFVIAKGNNTYPAKSAINLKVNQYYFDIGFEDDDLLYKKRSHKRRKVKRKPRRGRDNR